MEHQRFHIQPAFHIQQLISFYYLEMGKNFNSNGEQHNFWEFLYVDNGAIEIWANQRYYQLGQGDLVFYTPNQFHIGRVNQDKPPNVVIMSFECHSPSMERFENQSFSLTNTERNLLSEIVREGLTAFHPPIHAKGGGYPLVRHPQAPLGAEQLIRNGLEKLLIYLARRMQQQDSVQQDQPLATVSKEARDEALIREAISYLQAHPKDFTLDELAEHVRIAKAPLKRIFKQRTGLAPRQYWLRMRIESAKLMIRKDDLNISEIAESLGYNSVHYFSRQFKKETEMTPSEYAKSIAARWQVRDN